MLMRSRRPRSAPAAASSRRPHHVLHRRLATQARAEEVRKGDKPMWPWRNSAGALTCLFRGLRRFMIDELQAAVDGQMTEKG